MFFIRNKAYTPTLGTVIEGGYRYADTRSGMNMAELVSRDGTAFHMRGVYSTNTTVLYEGNAGTDINNKAAIAANSDFNQWYMSGALQ